VSASRPPEQPISTSAVDPAQRSRTSRAGRNLWAAIAVGLSMGAAILVALYTVRQLFIGIVAATVAISTWELVSASPCRRSSSAGKRWCGWRGRSAGTGYLSHL
jgi:phosphatidate cytidylyltransferase